VAFPARLTGASHYSCFTELKLTIMARGYGGIGRYQLEGMWGIIPNPRLVRLARHKAFIKILRVTYTPELVCQSLAEAAEC
jgi:hypothetical protein